MAAQVPPRLTVSGTVHTQVPYESRQTDRNTGEITVRTGSRTTILTDGGGFVETWSPSDNSAPVVSAGDRVAWECSVSAFKKTGAAGGVYAELSVRFEAVAPAAKSLVSA